MDKRMQKIRYEEIMSLVADRDFANAADIADTIEWRDEKKYTTLIKISNLYRLDDQPDKALDLMLMAYDLKPRSKKVVFGLCDLYLDRKDTVKATEFYKIYEHMAPDTAERLILKYRLVELCNGSVDTLISILEDMRHLSPSHPEWRYQLAYLYHRTGNVKKCVETCDDIVTWFIKGPFVVKALELKMLHQRLTPRQQEIYDSRNDVEDEIEAYEGDEYTAEKYDDGEFSGDIMVKPISIAKCDTINLSKELAESMAELLAGEEKGGYEKKAEKKSRNTLKRTERFNWEKLRKEREQQEAFDPDEEYYPEEARNEDLGETGRYTEDIPYDESGGEYYTDDMGYTGDVDYTGDMGDTRGDLGYTGDMGDTRGDFGYTEDMGYTDSGIQYTGDMNYTESDLQYTEEQGYGPDDGRYYTDNIPYDERRYEEEAYNTDSDLMYTQEMERAASAASEAVSSEKFFEDKTDTIVIDTPPTGTNPNFTGHGYKAGEEIKPVEKGVALGGQYYQADDGQFNLAIPFEPVPDKQITGQINISDALENWEKIKQRNDEQIRRETRQAILDTTGPIFERFDRESRDVISREPRVIVKESSSHIFGDMYDTEGIELVDIGSEEEQYGQEEYAVEEPEAYVESEVDEEVSVNGVSQETHGTTIWKEVDAAIRAEKEAKEAAEAAENAGAAGLGEAVAEGATEITEAAGAVVEGAVDAAGAVVEGAVEVGSLAAEGAMAAGVAAESAALAEDGLAAEGAVAAAEAVGAVAGVVADAVTDSSSVSVSEAAEVPHEEEVLTEETALEENDIEENDIEETATEEELFEEEEFNDEEPVDEEFYEDEEYYEEPYEDDQAYDEDVSLNTSQMEQISDALETDADRIGVETVEENNDEYIPEEGDEADFSEEELRIFDHFLYSRKMRRNILEAIDRISLAPYVGNAIITGEEKEETRSLARALLREIQLIDINFLNNHVARVSGDKMNNKDVATVLSQLANGALLIEDASGLFRDTLEKITNVLENTEDGVIVIMIDEKEAIDRMIEDYPVLSGYFNARIDMPPLTDGALVDYAKSYAYKKEYKIDEERAVLALHQRIDELQIGEHNVTLAEVEQIVDDAIARSGRRPVSSFFEILSGKRYDNKEDMIVLKEKDFQRKSGTVA